MAFVRQRVVVPVDFTDSTREALRVAASIADAPSHVYAVHVLTASGDERSTLDRLEALLQEHGLDGARPLVAHGDPATNILRHAERVGADLIVIPSRKGPLQRLLVGSVAEAVVRGAPCAVLVLRG